jgi:hypothetical protein
MGDGNFIWSGAFIAASYFFSSDAHRRLGAKSGSKAYCRGALGVPLQH